MILNKITDLYKKFEVYISVVTFSTGLVMTFFTLTRVDMFMENFWIVMNIFIVVFAVFGLTLYENRLKKKNITTPESGTFHFYFTLLIQFAFGGLFATYFVFYIRSSSISDSWLFLLILLTFLVGNEIWKKHYTRLVFQTSILFLSLFLFFIFLLPVLFHRLGADLFIGSGLLSLLLIWLFVYLLRKFALEKFQHSHRALKFSITAIFLAMNILYFTNIIPPIPLSLKVAGVYHGIVRNSQGDYVSQEELASWWHYFMRFPVFHRQGNEAIYVFSAIFSPVNFATEMVHQWQYYDEKKGAWMDSTRIVLPISGGREDGFRTYSFKYGITPGRWRVKVITVSGQILGKINFQVENTTSPTSLITRVL